MHVLFSIVWTSNADIAQLYWPSAGAHAICAVHVNRVRHWVWTTVAHNCHGKRINLTAKRKTSRQKEKDSWQKGKPHGKKKNLMAKRKNLTAKRKTSWQKEKPHGKKKKAHGEKKILTAKRKILAAKRKRLTGKEIRIKMSSRHGRNFVVSRFLFAVRFFFLPWVFFFLPWVFFFLPWVFFFFY